MHPLIRISKILLLIICSLWTLIGYAQQTYQVTGIVIDDSSQPKERATVFINGTQRLTMTDNEGRFSIPDLAAGSYDISVSMVGYETHVTPITVRNQDIALEILLKQKLNLLEEVRIGPDRFDDNFKIFSRMFIGVSAAAKDCEILNPQVLTFGYVGNKLNASADDFLNIENRYLGYKLRYSLKSFEYDTHLDVALYDGQVVFEDLPGTAQQKERWRKNRLSVYRGSMMHFLRSVFSGKALREGFITQQFYSNVTKGSMDLIAVNDRPVNFDTLVTAVDTSFKTLRFTNLYLQYAPGKAGKLTTSKSVRKIIPFGRKASVIRLVADEALIDRRGSYPDHRTFFIFGHLARRRVGDMLPFEYEAGK